MVYCMGMLLIVLKDLGNDSVSNVISFVDVLVGVGVIFGVGLSVVLEGLVL